MSVAGLATADAGLVVLGGPATGAPTALEAVALGFPWTDLTIALAAVAFGAPLIAVDVREHRLPDRLTGPAALVIAVVAAAGAIWGSDGRLLPTVLTGLGMALAGYLLAVLSPGAFGMGDVKLLGVIGLALGHLDPELVALWLLALSACSALWLVVAGRFDRQSDLSKPWRLRHIAFGPPMIVAWWLVYVVLAVAAT